MLLDMGTNAYNEAIFLGLKLTLLNPSVLLSQSMFLSRHRAQRGSSMVQPYSQPDRQFPKGSH